MLSIRWLLIAFIVLHNPDGKEVFARIDEIQFIGPVAQGESVGACSRLMIHGVFFWIKECPDAIKKGNIINLW